MQKRDQHYSTRGTKAQQNDESVKDESQMLKGEKRREMV